ncbi:hypothetical protein OAA60_03090 [Porticoccaceae bacterium]|nr:hypothetical protein [Porticoccaceae bacterium]
MSRKQMMLCETHNQMYLDVCSKCAASSDTVSKRYEELIMEVQNKIPNESRHETARRIIRQHENQENSPQGERQ